jgi:predicted dinucleotide-binding enzyme
LPCHLAAVVAHLSGETRRLRIAAAFGEAPQQLADGDHTIFVAGDDAAARAHVTSVLQDLGWSDIVEFPALEAARGLEMYLPLWVRLMGQLGTPQFNLKLVR